MTAEMRRSFRTTCGPHLGVGPFEAEAPERGRAAVSATNTDSKFARYKRTRAEHGHQPPPVAIVRASVEGAYRYRLPTRSGGARGGDCTSSCATRRARPMMRLDRVPSEDYAPGDLFIGMCERRQPAEGEAVRGEWAAGCAEMAALGAELMSPGTACDLRAERIAPRSRTAVALGRRPVVALMTRDHARPLRRSTIPEHLPKSVLQHCTTTAVLIRNVAGFTADGTRASGQRLPAPRAEQAREWLASGSASVTGAASVQALREAAPAARCHLSKRVILSRVRRKHACGRGLLGAFELQREPRWRGHPEPRRPRSAQGNATWLGMLI